MTVRAVRPGDAGGLTALFRSLGCEDLYLRFFIAHVPPGRFVTDMTTVAARGGYGLVAAVATRGGAPRMVAEAGYELVGEGQGELGITVARGERGWLGPYLLDLLVERARERGVATLRADVLLTNRRMLTLLRGRGFAVMDHDEAPATLKVVFATAGRVPVWPGPHGTAARVVAEAAGGRWAREGAVREAGYEVLVCPGPGRGWDHCPATRGQPCPLVAGADVVVDALPGELGRLVLRSHLRHDSAVPVCAEAAPGVVAPPPAVGMCRSDPDGAVLDVLGRLARPLPAVSV